MLGARFAGGLVVHRVGARLAPDLAVTASGLEELCSQAIVGAFVGAVLAPVCWVVASFGVRVPWVIPAWASLALAAAGLCLPFLVLPVEAARARREARRAIGSFLDLVVLCVAGGMGIESALHASAGIGRHDMSYRLARALAVARDSGQPPWTALEELGHSIGVEELVELASALGLAGREGARIRTTLAAKAAALRQRELSVTEAEANRVTERLFLPGILLLVGFLLFIGYPAVTRLVGGL